MELRLEGHDFQYDLDNICRIFDCEGTVISRWDPTARTACAIDEDGIEECEAVSDSLRHHADVAEDKSIKNALKRTMYRLLSNKTGKESPWGILVGVRPVKLVHECMDDGMDDAAIAEHLRNNFLIRDDKIKLLLGIAHIERPHVFPPDPKEISLYVGIPFCVSRCYYCSFPGFLADRHQKEMGPYLDALHKEIALVAERVRKEGFHVASLYIGGGTPTAIPAEALENLINHLKSHFDFSTIKEFTIEAGRPDTLDDRMLEVLRDSGAGRLCLNPQTMNDKTLVRIGRTHDADTINRLYTRIKEVFGSSGVEINMDLIAGLEGERVEDFDYTLKRVVELKPENITVHTLSIKRASKLHEDRERYVEALDAEDAVAQMVELAAKHLGDASYLPYYMYRQKNILANLENVGYALPGKECIYNMKIMEEKNTLLGMGLGASSKIYAGDNRFERHNNHKSLKDYTERLEEMVAKKMSIMDSCGFDDCND